MMAGPTVCEAIHAESQRGMSLVVVLPCLLLLDLTVCPDVSEDWHPQVMHYELQAGRLAESTRR
jgi:hypothetical protein